MEQELKVGDRVVLRGSLEFPDGTTGTVSIPPEAGAVIAEPWKWEGHRRIVEDRKGPILFYWVEFDEPADDGSGDGPYFAAEINADALVREQKNG